jgi:hypothetical protein
MIFKHYYREDHLQWLKTAISYDFGNAADDPMLIIQDYQQKFYNRCWYHCWEPLLIIGISSGYYSKITYTTQYKQFTYSYNSHTSSYSHKITYTHIRKFTNSINIDIATYIYTIKVQHIYNIYNKFTCLHKLNIYNIYSKSSYTKIYSKLASRRKEVFGALALLRLLAGLLLPSVLLLTPRVTESLIKLQLNPNAILNQDTKVWNQIQSQRFKVSSFV